MPTSDGQRIAAALAVPTVALAPLAGGSIARVYRVDVATAGAGSERFVAKLSDGDADGGDRDGEGASSELEAAMLQSLRASGAVPVPRVQHASTGLLILEWMPGSTGVSARASADAGQRIAALHRYRSPEREARFGWECDTAIGPLRQPNRPTASFAAFFANERLRYMSARAFDRGRLPSSTVALVERVAARLPELVEEPPHPSLVHGDLWSGNVLTHGDRLTAVLDPAVHWGHPEVDMAFSTMFGGFDEGFYRAYEDAGGTLDDGFWRERRHLWNLWPLLVHAALFGGSYAEQVAATARRFA